MEMMMEEFATPFASEDQLRTYLNEHPEKFREEDRLSFVQLYFPVEGRQEASDFLGQLQRVPGVLDTYQGGLLMLPDRMDQQSATQVARRFGREFAKELLDLEDETWHGPIASPYGWHLVYIQERIRGELPALDHVEAALRGHHAEPDQDRQDNPGDHESSHGR